ncbi:uncharacterized protein LOC105441928 [Strongylocentrotus purpuratus]|uniref:Uncharacterized protein n=1 Tax=Strongylocentrotus purpuratus TaxID=7668 RepID=A0A7M7SSK3_STRPU|nr:uncharacterized protein LOC105441928 [Strongylocentrotus purpuratus]
MSVISRTISLCLAVAVFTLIDGAYGDMCPSDYGFSCPRPYDSYDWTTCCSINGIQQCCNPTILATWAIGAIVTTCFFISFFFILIVCACCPCCWLASRRRHNRYVVVSNETPVAYPANSTTRTTYVYNTYPAQPNYNSTGYGQPTAPPMGATTTTTYVKQ